MKTSSLPLNIFREYDIRGIADKELTDEVSFFIGKAFGSVLRAENKKTIAVSYDMRPSSTRIQAALVKGLVSAGLEVIDLGMLPTPVLYFSVSHLKLDAGISITGSHNPPEFNGFKLHLADRPFFGSEIQGLSQRIQKGDFIEGNGSVRKTDIIEDYKRYIRNSFKFKKKLKVVIDAGHAMAAMVAPDLIRSMGHEVVELYTNIDPTFPDHHPDPSVPENLHDLVKKVLETKADVGLGFDGDADRIGVVDEKGEIIFGDKILLLYAREILKRKPGAAIIGDVKCSQVVYDGITKAGGKAIMWKTGHSLIKAKMKETHAELAGEMSGHMFFMDRWFGFDDAVYAACRMLEIVDQASGPLSTLLADVPHTYSTPEIRFECPDEEKFKVVEKLVKHFQNEKLNVLTIDGARITFSDGWGLVRASNTQPVLVMRFEATSPRRLEEIQTYIEKAVQKFTQK